MENTKSLALGQIDILYQSLPSVRQYEDYRLFLKDCIAHLRKNRRFSLRAFSKRVGFAGPAFMPMVLAGKRNLSVESARRVARQLRLSQYDADYFELLVELKLKSDPDSLAKIRRQMEGFRLANQGSGVNELTLSLSLNEFDWVKIREEFIELAEKMARETNPTLPKTSIRIRISCAEVNKEHLPGKAVL